MAGVHGILWSTRTTGYMEMWMHKCDIPTKNTANGGSIYIQEGEDTTEGRCRTLGNHRGRKADFDRERQDMSEPNDKE